MNYPTIYKDMHPGNLVTVSYILSAPDYTYTLYTTYNDNRTGYLSITEYSTYRYYVSTCIIMIQHTIDQYQSKRT